MKFCFLGTCAYDYSPLLKTIYADKLDKDARRSSAALIDDHILIDCGDHTLDSLRIKKANCNQIDTVLLTHLHSDHYKPESLRELAEKREERITVYVCQTAVERVKKELEGANVKVCGVQHGQKTEIEENMFITALPANHTEHAVHYLIESEEKSIYYALDGAWMMYDAFYALRDKDLDLLVLDCTVGDYEGDYRVAEHNSIPMIRLMLASFEKFNICNNGKVFISHIAPSLHKSHAETEELLKKNGVQVAYDGLEFEV